MTWTQILGDRYLDYTQIEAWCHATAAQFPQWVTVTTAGRTRHGRDILLVRLAVEGADCVPVEDRASFWIDGGTHASEFTSVMATAVCLSRWVTALRDGDEAAVAWFSRHAVHAIPCVSPDGFQAMCDGHPFLRSSLRPPKPGTARVGLQPDDIDGDGRVLWMRWPDPAGPWVPDEEVPILMRPRKVDDDPSQAYFVCQEGTLLNWDGVRWTAAPRKYGVDLNRNFPGGWAPFEMFGMDGGSYPLSEEETRTVVDTFAALDHVACGVTNHTYTGCVLIEPHSEDSPLGKLDLTLLEDLANDAVEGTEYKVFKVHPDFRYDLKRKIVGVWSETMCTVFGVAGYTVELWSPFRYAGLDPDSPLDFLLKPKPEEMRQVVAKFVEDGAYTPWRAFDHPQLGAVEIGGIDYLRTVRNPPEASLALECDRGFRIADRIRRAVPEVTASVTATDLGDGLRRIELVLENTGFLSTSSLAHGESIGAAPRVGATLVLAEGVELLEGSADVSMHHLDGWGCLRAGNRNPIYPSLPGRGHRARAVWLVRGEGRCEVQWVAGRGGKGSTPT